ncbi:MAG: hypothetical protein ACK41D_04905 [Rubricoccaceae bacterium]
MDAPPTPLSPAPGPSGPSGPASLAPPAPEPPVDPPPSPRALARLGRVLPRVDRLVRFAYRVAGASALSALVLWWVLVGRLAAGGRLSWFAAGAFLLLLCVPAGATWVAGKTVAELAALPGRLREQALAAAQGSVRGLRREARSGPFAVGLLRALWAARGLLAGGQATWARAASLARLVRVASLPFLLVLSVLMLLNVVVIPAGLVALVLLLRGLAG